MSNDKSLDSVREQYESLLQKSGGKIVRLSPDHKNKINQLVETILIDLEMLMILSSEQLMSFWHGKKIPSK